MDGDITFTPSDDVEALKALSKQATLIRKRGNARTANTASKVELLLSKAISEAGGSTEQGETQPEA